MVIVWTRMGAVVMLIPAICFFATIELFSALHPDPFYLQTHAWPKFAMTGVSSGLIYLFARVRRGSGDTLYGIPAMAWTYIVLALGLWFSFSDYHLIDQRLACPARAAGAGNAGATVPELDPAFQNSRVPEPQTPGALRLQGVFYRADGSSTAIIDGLTVSVGDKIGTYTVSAIDLQSVTVKSVEGKERILTQDQIRSRRAAE